MDMRLAVCGNVDAGKSTLIGVLTQGKWDDGRGVILFVAPTFGVLTQVVFKKNSLSAST